MNASPLSKMGSMRNLQARNPGARSPTVSVAKTEKQSTSIESNPGPTSKSFQLDPPPAGKSSIKPFPTSPTSVSKAGSVTSPKRASVSGSFISKPGSVASIAASVRKSDVVRSMFTASIASDRVGSSPEVAIQHILRACKYYEEKIKGKEAEFGPGARLVRELAKEVRREVQTLEQSQRDADAAQHTMGRVLESYVDVFNDPETLAEDLSLALHPEQRVDDFSNVVLTPKLLREAISAYAKRVVALQGDLAALQARWARDLARFEQSMQRSQAQHAAELQAQREAAVQTHRGREGELRRAEAARQAAGEELAAAQKRVAELEGALAAEKVAAAERGERLLARIEELEWERGQKEATQRRAAAAGHLREVAVLEADILSAMRSIEAPLPNSAAP